MASIGARYMNRFRSLQGSSLFVVVLMMILTSVRPSAAQTTTSTIYGVIKDSAGGVLPGVTVSVSGPALQVPSVTTISEADGNYRVTDLPAGVYEVVYELPGFTKIVRKDIRITTGFLAKLDAAMTVGGLEETITVSGGSPIVDVSATSTGATLTRDLVEAIPRSKEFSTLLAMTPGVTASGAPDV